MEAPCTSAHTIHTPFLATDTSTQASWCVPWWCEPKWCDVVSPMPISPEMASLISDRLKPSASLRLSQPLEVKKPGDALEQPGIIRLYRYVYVTYKAAGQLCRLQQASRQAVIVPSCPCVRPFGRARFKRRRAWKDGRNSSLSRYLGREVIGESHLPWAPMDG